MITSVDTNILLDILSHDPEFFEQSANLLQQHSNLGGIVICPVIYSELLVFFLKKHGMPKAESMLIQFLTDFDIKIIDFSRNDFSLAAEAWRKIDGGKVMCPKCGVPNTFNCAKCKVPIFWRNHIIADFLIGAHSQNHSEILLTRDKAYYRKYFSVKTLP